MSRLFYSFLVQIELKDHWRTTVCISVWFEAPGKDDKLSLSPRRDDQGYLVRKVGLVE